MQVPRRVNGVVLGLAAAALLGFHFVAGFSWAVATLAALVGWPLLGTLLTLDDDLSGGWSNPDGTVRPEWLGAAFWIQIAASLSVSAFVAAFEYRGRAFPFAIVGLVAALIAVSLFRRAARRS